MSDDTARWIKAGQDQERASERTRATLIYEGIEGTYITDWHDTGEHACPPTRILQYLELHYSDGTTERVPIMER